MYCNKVFDDKVRDHCHFTGEYRGASCYICNLEEKNTENSFQYIVIIYQDLTQV